MIRALTSILLSVTGLLILTFILLKSAPGNPIELILAENNKNISLKNSFKETPAFYFSFHSLSQNGIGEFIPAVSFTRNNLFHYWIFGDENSGGLVKGDFGRSIVTGEKVSSMISPALSWSLLITLLAAAFAYFISIRFAFIMAHHENKWQDKLLKLILNFLYVIPVYWGATLLIYFFCNPDIINVLPSSGVGTAQSVGLFSKIISTLPYLILPTLAFAYGMISTISRTLRNQMSDLLKEDFVLTARAKGLSEKSILSKHVFKNALLPVIALFSRIFPLLIGGSVIVESIFSIPGMGQLLYRSLLARDYPVITAVFFLTGLITIIGFRLANVAYSMADPRINLKSSLA